MSMNSEKKHKILLVDDSESDRAIYCRYLSTDEDVDYQILEAETLTESLELWRSQFPDMVLADLYLPDGNGLELLTAIQAKDTRQKCPVVVITGQGNEQMAVQAMKLGARDYLVKGDITATVLGNCVKNALNQWTTSKELTEFSQESENYNLGNITNIPDYKQAEQENIRLRKRFQFLLTSSPTIIYSCKPYGDYGATFISDNTETILGYQPEQFITQESFWANHLHPEDAPKIFAEISALFEKGTHTHEYRFLHRDGHYLWIRDQLQLVKDDQGNPIEIIGSFSDISDHKNQEKELRESETRFRQLAENIDEVFYLVDIQVNQMLYIPHSAAQSRKKDSSFVLLFFSAGLLLILIILLKIPYSLFCIAFSFFATTHLFYSLFSELTSSCCLILATPLLFRFIMLISTI